LRMINYFNKIIIIKYFVGPPFLFLYAQKKKHWLSYEQYLNDFTCRRDNQSIIAV